MLKDIWHWCPNRGKSSGHQHEHFWTEYLI
jgi:hypothetical protein